MILPTPSQCRNYFKQYQVPQNIFQHCLKVQEVSIFLTEELNKMNQELDIKLVSSLAILHDLFKVVVFKELKPNQYHAYQFTTKEIAMWKKLRQKYAGLYEGDVAYEVLKDDFPEFALALKKVSNPYIQDKSPEQALVHYVDWRILQEEIISLSKRVAYLKQMYSENTILIEAEAKEVTLSEKNIFAKLSFGAEELQQKMKDDKKKV